MVAEGQAELSLSDALHMYVAAATACSLTPSSPDDDSHQERGLGPTIHVTNKETSQTTGGAPLQDGLKAWEPQASDGSLVPPVVAPGERMFDIVAPLPGSACNPVHA